MRVLDRVQAVYQQAREYDKVNEEVESMYMQPLPSFEFGSPLLSYMLDLKQVLKQIIGEARWVCRCRVSTEDRSPHART